jgi:hypothetical protein
MFFPDSTIRSTFVDYRTFSLDEKIRYREEIVKKMHEDLKNNMQNLIDTPTDYFKQKNQTPDVSLSNKHLHMSKFLRNTRSTDLMKKSSDYSKSSNLDECKESKNWFICRETASNPCIFKSRFKYFREH